MKGNVLDEIPPGNRDASISEIIKYLTDPSRFNIDLARKTIINPINKKGEKSDQQFEIKDNI